MTNCSVRTHFNKVIKNLFSLATDEVAENLPFPDGKEISSTDRDWQYTTTGIRSIRLNAVPSSK